jgi:hypothetical protein
MRPWAKQTDGSSVPAIGTTASVNPILRASEADMKSPFNKPFGSRSPFGSQSVEVAVLTLIEDGLEEAIPFYSMSSSAAGTLYWDFHSSATPPAVGTGDHLFGSQAIGSGITVWDTDLSAAAGETGYLHYRVTNSAGTSNILTSQQITVPVAATAAETLLATWGPTDGLAFDFTDVSGTPAGATAYGSGQIIDSVTPANNWETTTGVTPFDKLTFARASTAYYYNSSGILTAASSGVARVDHNPSTLACLGLLFEKAATNLCLQSNGFDTTWTSDNSTDTSASATSPDGTTNAWKLEEGTAAGRHIIYQTGVFGSNAVYTWSIYVKNGDRRYVQMQIDAANDGNVYFDLQSGTVSDTNAGTASVSGSIQPLPNGWYRCSVSYNPGADGVTLIFSLSDRADDTSGSFSFVSPSYTGTDKYVYVYGSQVEDGSYQTSYIPTTTTTVARVAETCSLLATNYNQSSSTFTVYAKATTRSVGITYNTIITVDDGTTDERHILRLDSADPIAYVLDGGSITAQIDTGTASINSVFKFAMSVATNDIAACFNGGTVGTDTSATLPTVNRFRIGSNSIGGENFDGHIQQIMIIPQTLSDANLQTLTT